MAIAKRQGVDSTAASTTAVFAAVLAGSLLTVTCRNGAVFSTQSFSDSVNGAWTIAYHQDEGVDHSLIVAYFKGSAAGTPTLTATVPAGTCRLLIEEWTTTSGIAAVSAGVSAQGASPVTSGDITAALGDLVYGSATNDNSLSLVQWTAGGTSAGGTWATSQVSTEAPHPLYSQSVIATAAGTFASFPTEASAANCTSGAVTFSETAAAAPPPSFPNPAATNSFQFKAWARERWTKRRSGLLVPDHPIWLPTPA